MSESEQAPELVIVQALSTRMIEAQRQIRILDCIKWA